MIVQHDETDDELHARDASLNDFTQSADRDLSLKLNAKSNVDYLNMCF